MDKVIVIGKDSALRKLGFVQAKLAFIDFSEIKTPYNVEEHSGYVIENREYKCTCWDSPCRCGAYYAYTPKERMKLFISEMFTYRNDAEEVLTELLNELKNNG